MWYVYLLRCADGSTYTGCTSNIEARMERHRRGEVNYTSTRLPVELSGYTAFTDKYKAYDFERYLKTGSGRAFAKKRLL